MHRPEKTSLSSSTICTHSPLKIFLITEKTETFKGSLLNHRLYILSPLGADRSEEESTFWYDQ